MSPGFLQLLQALPLQRKTMILLRRLVAKEALASCTTPDHLYTSGYAYRVNTAASRALYGSEDAATAGAEWERQAKASPRLLRQELYFVEVTLPIVDLGDAATLDKLGLSDGDLQEPWQFAPSPTKLQLLGDAVAIQHRFGAVRFPSYAARMRGFVGFNFALFPSAIVAPMSVIIRNDAEVELQRWPAP